MAALPKLGQTANKVLSWTAKKIWHFFCSKLATLKFLFGLQRLTYRPKQCVALRSVYIKKKVTMLDWKENKKLLNLLLHGKDHKLWQHLPLCHVTDLPLPVDGGLSSKLFGHMHMTSQKCALAKIYFFSSQKRNKIKKKTQKTKTCSCASDWIR